MTNLKNTKGITLVALVITIIILIILASVTLSMVLDQNGLIGKAKDGADRYKEEATIEQNEINNVTAFIDSIISGSGTTSSNNPTSNSTYTLGQEVTVGGEKFFVIEENDTASKDTITLITKYNLNPLSNAQLNASYESTGLLFSTGVIGYWADISGITYPYDLNGIESESATAYNKAVAYANAIKTAAGNTGTVEGRLLTSAEAEILTESDKIPKIIYGQDYTTNPVTRDNCLAYWLGTAKSAGSLRCVNGGLSGGSLTNVDFDIDGAVGVRPVITISKSLVS